MPIPQLQEKKTKNLDKKRKILFKKIFKMMLIAGVICFLIGVIVLVGAFAWVSKDIPDPDKINERAVAESTKIYDRTGETILYEIHGDQKRTLVKLEDIPNYAKWATISLEDQKFYSHHGFDLKGIMRAVYKDIIQRKKAEGASTITQQLVKNSILTSEKKWQRKFKELILSYQLENKFTKDQILQMYLNEIPYGSVAYGIQSAAQTYFGKDVQDLTLAESALLASLPKGPTYFSPYGSHVDELMWRKDYAIDQMVELGYITQDEAEEAKAEEINFLKQKGSIIAPHFVMYVKEMLTEEYGSIEVEEGGLKVITTIDLDKQQYAEEAIEEYAARNKEQFNASNAALSAVDPKTGQILAMVGSIDYFDTENDGNVNVTIRPRQPGSSIKPIVYATAFEKGYTPDTILFDVLTSFKTDAADYVPKNFNLREHGPISIRKALGGSLNIPAVKALYLAGVNTVLDKTDELDYSDLKDRDRYGLALVLGGGEVKLLDHVSAFGAFATDGKKHATTTILSVEDRNGKILQEFEDKEKRVWDENVARQVNSILSDNSARAWVFGTNNYLTLGARPVAAKTGTTNDYRDFWTVGYTPSLVSGVWVGNNDNSEMARGASSAQVAGPIWNSFMTKALEGTKVESFTDYKRIGESKKPILGGKVGNEVTVQIDTSSGKLATEFTPESYIEEKTFMEYHCILYYVNKDNPWGPIPSNPSSDEQFSSWEGAVLAWAKRKAEEEPGEGEVQFEFGAPPEESDDVHTLENQPTLEIVSPQNNQTISNLTLNVSVNVSAPRGVAKVDYYLDNEFVSSQTAYPFGMSHVLKSNTTNGYHSLTVIACDDVDNCTTKTIDFNLLAERTMPDVSFISPKSSSKYYTSSFPLKLSVYTNDPYAIKKINFYYQHDSETRLIAIISRPEQETITVNWPSVPEAGVYQIYGEVHGDKGERKETGRVVITVE